MVLKNLEQERAKFALQKIKTAIKEPEDGGLGENAKYYRSYIEKMPSLILNAGLVAAFAFVKGKMGDKDKPLAYKMIYEAMNSWLRPQKAGLLESDKKDLLEALIEKKSLDIRLLTYESIAMLGWLKRIAKAEIEETGEE